MPADFRNEIKVQQAAESLQEDAVPSAKDLEKADCHNTFGAF